MDFLGLLVIWLPRVYPWLTFLPTAFLYFKRLQLKNPKTQFLIIFFVAVALRILRAVFETILQFLIWREDEFTRPWLTSGYFVTYALIFYFFLKAMERRASRFFELGEPELGLVTAFLAGWPHFIIFVPLTFFIVLILSIIRRIFLKEFYTTLGLPFLISLLIVIVFNSYLFKIFNLVVLKI
jgi:hypothetical protein